MRTAYAFVLLALVACGGGDTTAVTTPAIVGSWTGLSIDGVSLPANNGSVAWYGDTVIVFARGDYRRATVTGFIGKAPTTISESGVWSTSGAFVLLTPDALQGPQHRATVTGGQMAMTVGLGTWTYRRQ